MVLVHQTGIERADQCAAVLNVEFEQVRFAAGEQFQRRRNHQFVFRQVLGGPREIHRDVPVVERVVKELDVLPMIEIAVGLRSLLQRPFVFVAEENARFRHDPGSLEHRRQQFHFIANVADFPVNPVVTAAVVRQHAPVELFRTDPRLPPEEVKQAGGAAGNRLVSEQPDDARADQ